MGDATLRPEVRVASIFATAIAPAARTVRELLQGASSVTRAAALCARAAFTDATMVSLFYLFTVTFCANPANDLTCPPSYIWTTTPTQARAQTPPTSIEAQANAIVLAHVAVCEKPQCR